ncbi:MAG: helix-hairpin-helix domain-containing protein [Eubacteriales bacterium]|nr:helix-hairpin-helix domain-containing protein [Eubacteriales bacterium]
MKKWTMDDGNKERKRTSFSILILFWMSCAVSTTGISGCRARTEAYLEEVTVTREPEITEEQESLETYIYVDVQGAVSNPGVYKMQSGDRVFKLLEAAGGCLPEAYPEAINQAAVLLDGEQIRIPTKEEVQKNVTEDTGLLTSQGTESTDGKVDLNSADESELCTLTGIGQAKAKAIIQYRESHGAFSSIEELMNVEGIKEGTFRKIEDEITVR